MTATSRLRRIVSHEGLNFALTNWLPRRGLTRLFGWFSRIEQPWVRDLSIRCWRVFTDLDLSDARQGEFRSLHDCFTRELVPGARPFCQEPDLLGSPSDAIVGQCGRIDGATLLQAKGRAYRLEELLVDASLAEAMRDGSYVTLRLTSAMYHRFHSPAGLRVKRVTYVSGDVWNVNPPALDRVERLYCRNERAILETVLDETTAIAAGTRLLLVPVAAILVASIRLRFLDVRLHLRYNGPNRIECDAGLARGAEMGWFEHGSTIIVLAPPGFRLADGISAGRRVRAGEALLRASDDSR